MHRIVHIDCKGAPLKVPYLEQVLLLSKSWGATGFMMEWEDTFPYTGDLEDIGSLKNSGGDNMYSMEEVQHIFKFARDNGLEAIQLIQTIGHMEFVLKHPQFRELREVPSSPAVLCPSKEQSRLLVRMMVDQTLKAQPDAKYIHIGGDEVWHRGECSLCIKKVRSCRYERDCIYLDHIQDLSLYIKRKWPDMVVFIWDDMLRSIDEKAFKIYLLPNIQPVFWNYNIIEDFRIEESLWQKYSRLFRKMWIASAFKGANGSSQVRNPVSRYTSNHDAWIREMESQKNDIEFVGIILTGWSRYDHYATLCELMPVMLPSLSCCLSMMSDVDEKPRVRIPQRIRERRPRISSEDQFQNEILTSDEWPGQNLAKSIKSFITLRNKCNNLLNGETLKTWLNPWQIERNYTVCVQVQPIAYTARLLTSELRKLHNEMTVQFQNITGTRSTNEWLKTNISPLLAKISTLYMTADAAMKRDAAVHP